MIVLGGHILVITIPRLTFDSFTADDDIRLQRIPSAEGQRRDALVDWTDKGAAGRIAVEVISAGHQVCLGMVRAGYLSQTATEAGSLLSNLGACQSRRAG